MLLGCEDCPNISTLHRTRLPETSLGRTGVILASMALPSGQERIASLAAELRNAGADAYFATTPVSMGYLSGLFEDGHERFLTLAVSASGEVELICPSLTATQARRAGISAIRAWRDSENPLLLFEDLADRWNLSSGILAVDNAMPSKMLLEMQQVLPAALFRAGQPILAELMSRKRKSELELLRKAGAIADGALAAGLSAIRPGVTEVSVRNALRQAMEEAGGRPTFTIVATGAQGAEPHHESDETIIQDGDVIVMDFGCEYQGYQSDITRTVCCGKASSKAKEVYEIVFAAHQAGRAAIRPGVACEDVDRAARKVIESAGFGEYFVHRLGHGIGMRVHEEPYMVEGNKTPLEVGHCFSVEPGIYLAGELGIRIENIVTCTEQGHESINAEPSASLLEI